MRLHRDYSFDAACEDVYALLTDEAFQRERIADTGVDPTASVTHDSGGDVVTITLHLPTTGVPSRLKTFVGDQLTVTDERHWGAAEADGARRGNLSVRVAEVPVTMRGTVTLVPEGEGCVLSIDGDLRCSIPIVGRVVETQLAEGLSGVVDAEADAVAASLED